MRISRGTAGVRPPDLLPSGVGIMPLERRDRSHICNIGMTEKYGKIRCLTKGGVLGFFG